MDWRDGQDATTNAATTTTGKSVSHREVVEILVFILFGGALFLVICVVYAIRYSVQRLRRLNKGNNDPQQTEADLDAQNNTTDAGTERNEPPPTSGPPPVYSAAGESETETDQQDDSPPPYVLARSISFTMINEPRRPSSSTTSDVYSMQPYLPNYLEANSPDYNPTPPPYDDGTVVETHM